LSKMDHPAAWAEPPSLPACYLDLEELLTN
jgi:hypothetical protein